MNLKFFGHETDGAGSDAGNGGQPADSNAAATGAEGADKPATFDDILSDKAYQAEFDRRVQKATDTAVTNARSKWETLLDDKLSEAEKLSKMNEAEKAEYLRQKREKELQVREADITKRELMAEAKNTLAEKNLPAELAGVLVYTDAETCSASLKAVEAAFEKAVQAAVAERLKGGKPPKKASGGEEEPGSASSFVDVIKQNQSKR